MALWECGDCTTKFAVGLERCPHCGSTNHEEDGAMPKITRHEGASIWQGEHGPKLVDIPDSVTVHRPDEDAEGGEESSPGNSSSASSEKQQPSDEPSKPSSPKRARTTASRSRRGPTANSSASGTDGDQAAGTSASDD